MAQRTPGSSTQSSNPTPSTTFTNLQLSTIIPIIEELNSAIAILSDQGRYEYVNSNYADLISEFSHEDIIGSYTEDVINPAFDEWLSENVKPVLDETGQWDGTIDMAEFKNQYGSQYFDITISDIPDGGIVFVAEEITESVARENELERVYNAMETSMDGVAILNKHDEYEYVNHAHAEIHGYQEPEELIGESWRMLYDDEEIDRFESEIMPQLYSIGEWRGEAIGQKADGTTFHQEVSISTLQTGGLVCFVRDITEQKTREQELAAFKQAVENAGHSIILTDVDGTIEYVNPAVERNTGYTEDDLIGNTPNVFNSGEHNDEFFDEFWNTILDGRMWEGTMKNQKKNGELYQIKQTVSPIMNHNDEIEKFVGVNVDITEEELLNQSLRAMNDATRDLFLDLSLDQLAETSISISDGLFDSDVTVMYEFDEINDAYEPLASSISEPILAPQPIPTKWPIVELVKEEEMVQIDQPELIDDLFGDTHNFDTVILSDLGSKCLLAVGFVNEGKLTSYSPTLMDVLSNTITAALNRLSHVEELQDQYAELHYQHRQLEKLEELVEELSDVPHKLLDVSGDTVTQSAVCNELSNIDHFDAVMFTRPESDADEHQVLNKHNVSDDLIKSIDIVDDESPFPAIEAYNTGELVRYDVEGEFEAGSWEAAVATNGYTTILSVPVAYESITYGVITIFLDFTTGQEDVYEEYLSYIAELTAHKLHTLYITESLSRPEHESAYKFTASGVSSVFNQISTEIGDQIMIEYVDRVDDQSSLVEADKAGIDDNVYWTYIGINANVKGQSVIESFESVPDVIDAELVFNKKSRAVVKAVIVDNEFIPLFSELSTPASNRLFDCDSVKFATSFPTTTIRKSFIETFEDRFACNLDVAVVDDKDEQIASSVLEVCVNELTDKQFMALKTAYVNNFFARKRGKSSTELAEQLDVTQPTFSAHLRAAHQNLLDAVFKGVDVQ